jgi:DNA modification methylase
MHPEVVTVRYLATEDVPLAGLVQFPGNARRGDLGAIRASVARHGQYRSIVVRQLADGGRVIVAGNHTALALAAEGHESVRVDLIECDDGEARRINLADNRLAELGGYDDAALADLLASLDGDFGGTGWAAEDLAALLRGEPDSRTDPDDVPEPPVEPVTQPGDLWLLGPHRLLCGDATVAADIERLMGADRATLIYTDPPYGVEYEGGTTKRDMISGDDATGAALQDLFDAPFVAARLVGADRCAVVVWHAGAVGMPLYEAVQRHGWQVRAQIIWNKNLAQYGALSAQYKQKHEPALYCVRAGRPPKWNGPTNEITVWDCDRAARNDWHPTQKPVALGERAIVNHTDRGDVVLDLYGGSGSTMIAAHRQDRRARLLELDPVYCDVICQRFQEHTGIVPELGGRLAGVAG